MDQQEAIALERGEVALDYAVRLHRGKFRDKSDKEHRTLWIRSE